MRREAPITDLAKSPLNCVLGGYLRFVPKCLVFWLIPAAATVQWCSKLIIISERGHRVTHKLCEHWKWMGFTKSSRCITDLFEKSLVQLSFEFPAQSPPLPMSIIVWKIQNSIELKIFQTSLLGLNSICRNVMSYTYRNCINFCQWNFLWILFWEWTFR